MDIAVTSINSLTSAALALLCGYAVMAPLVRDGVVIKLGLVLSSIGHGFVAAQLWGGIECADLLTLNKARFVNNLGLLLVVIGYAVRHANGERLHQMLPQLFRGPSGD